MQRWANLVQTNPQMNRVKENVSSKMTYLNHLNVRTNYCSQPAALAHLQTKKKTSWVRHEKKACCDIWKNKMTWKTKKKAVEISRINEEWGRSTLRAIEAGKIADVDRGRSSWSHPRMTPLGLRLIPRDCAFINKNIILLLFASDRQTDRHVFTFINLYLISSSLSLLGEIPLFDSLLLLFFCSNTHDVKSPRRRKV